MTKHPKTLTDPSRRDALRVMAAGTAGGLFAANLLGQPAHGQTKPAAPKGRIVVGVTQEPTVFNPLMPHLEVDDSVAFSVFDALFRIDPKGVIVPNLATEVPTLANGGISADGLKWRIRLRNNVRWHDGTAFTAEDVKFTLELIVNPKFRAWRTTGHALVRDITVVSPTEIAWRMEQPFAPYLSYLTETFIVPKHILGAVANPTEAPFNQAPVGTGAFKWGKRVAGDHVELLANTGYHGEGPFIEKLIFKYIPDMTVMYTQFRSGDIDIAGRAFITPDNYKEASRLPDRNVTLVPAGSVESIYLNLEKPQFRDRVVREALYMAIDRQAIIDILYHGVARPTETFMPPQSWYYKADLPKHEFNLARAAQLLDQAGWKPGPDGIRAKDGVRLSFNNSTTTGAHLREQAQQFIQQTFAKLGVEMKILNHPAAVMFGDFWAKSQYDTAMVGITYLIASDPDVALRFHSRSIVAKGGRGSNNAQYANPEVDELLDKGERTFDPNARRAIYHRVQEIVRNDLPFLPLFTANIVYGRKAKIQGFVPNTNTRSEAWNAAGWSWS